MELTVAGIAFGHLSALQCYQQNPGEERRQSDMFTVMTYVRQGLGVILPEEDRDLDYGKRLNDELTIGFELDLDTRLIDVPLATESAASLHAEPGAEVLSSLDACLVKGLSPVMPAVIEAGLSALATAWSVEIGWQMVSSTGVTLTISHLLASFIGYVEKTCAHPTLFLGLTNGAEIDRKSDEWAADPDEFLDHFGNGLVQYLDEARLIAKLSDGEDRRVRLAAGCGFDVDSLSP